MIRSLIAMCGFVCCFAAATKAQDSTILLHANIGLESGDTWTENGQRYRLYGVQSCLRGTEFTNGTGRKLDCGDVSLAVLAAFIKDIQPRCTPIARRADLTYVVCFAVVGGAKLDLGTILISRGYAFAALDGRGMPLNSSYAVAEAQAKDAKAGLWQFPDVQHPALLLGKAAQLRSSK